MSLPRLVISLTFVICGFTNTCPAIAVDVTEVRKLLKRHCADCHDNGSAEGGLGKILDLERLVKDRRVLPSNAVESKLYARVIAGEMPPPGDEPTGERPSENEIGVLRNWIAEGALVTDSIPTRPGRPRITLLQELELIAAFLSRKATATERADYRFFSIRNIHNTAARTEQELDTYRAAFGKALNSLSWQDDIVNPVALDSGHTIFAVRLNDLKWDFSDWDSILSHYPYALSYERIPAVEEIRRLARVIYRETGTIVPVIRADWFVVTATKPPLYHTLLSIPKKLRGLEGFLRVDSDENFLNGNVQRAGFIQSGISEQNRLIERHQAKYGYFWKSYDFKPGVERSSLVTFPLGPAISGNRWPEFAFVHDGGEFIFSLPNGLQGYMLADRDGNRIDGPAPVEIVADRTRVGGSIQVINGISCIACHSQGIINKDDEILETSARGAVARNPDASRFLRKIYPGQNSMSAIYRKDREVFQKAVKRAMRAVVLNPGSVESEDGSALEPVSKVTRFYLHEPMDAALVAAELDLESADELRAALKFQQQLIRLGLSPLASSPGAIKRASWERRSLSCRSVFQRAASYLQRGEPVVTRRPGDPDCN